ncbi:MAG: hypothetical protein ACYC8T_36380, partial [Myxococcaceae bacterium]
MAEKQGSRHADDRGRGSGRRAQPAQERGRGPSTTGPRPEREPSKGGPARYVFGINPVVETLRARPDEIE